MKANKLNQMLEVAASRWKQPEKVQVPEDIISISNKVRKYLQDHD